ncbi:hypothetical protein [Maribacter sp. 2307ULW6-5]|uniref:hypothetical protein n=1 Tax=Maribacter sp. 2307ULW6-5 TaxID=3386275 RepID=UPI0039BD6D72
MSSYKCRELVPVSRIFIIGFSVLIFSDCYSQIDKSTEAYVGLGYYRHTGFDNNAYYHARLGLEIFSFKFISPEIDFTYYFGGNDRIGERNLQTGLPISRLLKNFRGGIWGISPKIYICDIDSRLVFIPKYHFGSVSADGLVITPNGRDDITETKSRIAFWSFSVGFENLIDNDRLTLGIYLTYTGFDAGESLNDISSPDFGFPNSETETSTIGLTARIGYRM